MDVYHLFDAVRAEEMINYFDYQYPQPNNVHPFSVNTETVDSPWKENAKLIKIGIQAKDLSTKQLPSIWYSWLMFQAVWMLADKLPLVKQTLRLLNGATPTSR